MKKALVLALFAVVALVIVNMVVPTRATKPDAVYPMANRNITWNYAGK